MNKNKVLLGLGGVLLVFTTITSIYLVLNTTKTGYFDYNTLYNNCTLKLKLEKDLEKVASQRKSELDSMQMELSFLSEKIKAGTSSNEELGKFEDMKNRFLTFQQQYEDENIRLKETYFTQIRTEIAEKAKTFAKEKGYDYLFTMINDGSMMYGSEKEDVTKAFQDYVDGK